MYVVHLLSLVAFRNFTKLVQRAMHMRQAKDEGERHRDDTNPSGNLLGRLSNGFAWQEVNNDQLRSEKIAENEATLVGYLLKYTGRKWHASLLRSTQYVVNI